MFLRKGLTGVMDYVSESHSKYLLMVHLIFVVKYRRNLLIKFGDEIKQIFYDIAKEKDIVIVEKEVDKNPYTSTGTLQTNYVSFRLSSMV